MYKTTKIWVLTALALLSAPGLVSAGELIAFTHEGTGSGTLDGKKFEETAFVITAIADKDDAVSVPPFMTFIPHQTASITIDGLGEFDFLTPTMTGAEHLGQFGAPAVLFGPFVNENPVGTLWGPLDGVFATWDTTTPIGPISAPGFHLGWAFEPMETTGGVVAFDDCFDTCEIDTTFTAVDVGTGMPIADLSPESFDFEMPIGGSDTRTLDIGNVGTANLDWQVEESEAGGSGLARAGVSYAYGLAKPPEFHAPVGSDRASGGVLRVRGKSADPLVLPALQAAAIGELAEGFDDITMLPGAGWAMINNSAPPGPTSWFQGNDSIFPSHQGDPDAYIAANFDSTVDNGDISNWLLTPELTIASGTTLCFWTRTSEQFGEFYDRLEVRMSVEGDSIDVGDTAESVGDFTTLLHTVNPELEPNEYPEQWTEICAEVRERSREPVTGRFAFRYWVTDSGANGSNGDYIGIDTVSVTQPGGGGAGCSNPLDVPWLSFTPATGTTPPGDSTPVAVTVDATELDEGEHTAQLCVTTNDPDAPLVAIPVHLTVGPAPGATPGSTFARNGFAAALSVPAESRLPPSR